MQRIRDTEDEDVYERIGKYRSRLCAGGCGRMAEARDTHCIPCELSGVAFTKPGPKPRRPRVADLAEAGVSGQELVRVLVGLNVFEAGHVISHGLEKLEAYSLYPLRAA
jgi:hypothetical protein